MTNTAITAIPARRKAGNASAIRQPKKARKDTITHFWETGDRRLFAGANPPCCVFRFVKGQMDRTMADGRVFAEHEGQLCFLPAGSAGIGCRAPLIRPPCIPDERAGFSVAAVR